MMPSALPFLTNDEHTYALRMICDSGTSLVTRKRAAILLLLHAGQNRPGADLPIREIARKAACSVWLVANLRRRFADGGMQAALFPPIGNAASRKSTTPTGQADPVRQASPMARDIQRRVRDSNALIEESHKIIQRVRSVSRSFNKMTADSQVLLGESWEIRSAPTDDE